MQCADRIHSNKELTVVELRTCLMGTAWEGFAQWLTERRMAVFLRFDADKSGSIDQVELEAALREYYQIHSNKSSQSPPQGGTFFHRRRHSASNSLPPATPG